MSRDLDVVRAGFRDARCDRPDPARGDQLDPDPCPPVDGPKVSDQLGEVLDRIDVVVGWRTDVGLAWPAPAKGGDIRRRLPPRKLAPLARFRRLGDLDLELVRPRQIRRRDTEAARGDLLDHRVTASAVRSGLVPRRVLAALAGVRRAAGALNADRQRLVSLGGERTDAHR